MKRLVAVLSPLGLVVMVGAVLWERSGRTLPGRLPAYLIAGAALMLAHLLLRWEDVVRDVGRRQMRYGANTAVLALVVLGILGAVNYLASRHSKRWDLTKGQRYSLADQTKKVLASLKEDVTITYFHKTADMSLGQDRLKPYESASPRVKVEFVDPIKNPGKAKQHEITRVPTVVVERGARREKASGDSEQDILNALIKVTRDATKTLCFVEGEGERDIEDGSDHGYSAVKTALTKSQYETRKVFLAREGKVPDACTLLVVAGPEKDLLPHAVDAVRAYVKTGGRAIVMVEPELKEAYPNLVALLREWNIEATKDVVVDINPMGQLFGTGPLTPLAAQYPYHEITRDFRVMTAFHTVRSVEAGKGTASGVSSQSLLQTTPASWAETDLTLKEPVEMNEGTDRQGPISLGAVATIRREAGPSASPSPAGESSPSPAASPSPASPSPESTPSGEPSPEPQREGRVVAFGDSDFASNALLGFQGNRDFFLNTVAWLAEDTDLISIRPKEPEDQRMFLTRQQQVNAAFVTLAVLPGLFVVLGIVVWWRRRG